MATPQTARAYRLAIAMALAVIATRCTSGPPPPRDDRPYDAQIMSFRATKDADFRAADNPYSPIPAAERQAFKGLPYYPIQPTYRVPAALHEAPSDPPVVISLPNSAHEMEQKVRVGTLAFSLEGREFTLSAFAENAGNVQRLWVPFRDLTSGMETYGGGRYLDLDRTASGVYDLDFNRAYHPYCVYNPTYLCPYPPKENRLTLAVRAGERLPESNHSQ